MLLPMFVLIIFTFLIMYSLGVMRILSVRNKQVPGKYYRLMSGFDVPEHLSKFSRHVTNTFETPILFYIVCTLYIVMDIHLLFAEILAWLYVLLRLIHAGIHLTYNHPIHRLMAFLPSTLCILVLWGVLLINA